MRYTHENGLKVLNYLGLTSLSKKESEIFIDKWQNFYNGNLIDAAWKLYSEALPFTCGDGNRDSFIVAQLRDSDFGKRLKATGLDEKLKQGRNLNEILEEGNYTFITILK